MESAPIASEGARATTEDSLPLTVDNHGFMPPNDTGNSEKGIAGPNNLHKDQSSGDPKAPQKESSHHQVQQVSVQNISKETEEQRLVQRHLKENVNEKPESWRRWHATFKGIIQKRDLEHYEEIVKKVLAHSNSSKQNFRGLMGSVLLKEIRCFTGTSFPNLEQHGDNISNQNSERCFSTKGCLHSILSYKASSKGKLMDCKNSSHPTGKSKELLIA